MDLVGRLSNTLTTSNLQCLTRRDWHKGRRRHNATTGHHPDGRRQFGSISRVIVRVLSEAGDELPVKEIQVRVEELLGTTLSRHSVKGYLHRACAARHPMVERRARGRYAALGREES